MANEGRMRGRGKGNNPQHWTRTASGNQENANINKELCDDAWRVGGSGNTSRFLQQGRAGQSGNWGSELRGDARLSRDQEPMSAQVPLVLVLFACPHTICVLPFGRGEKQK